MGLFADEGRSVLRAQGEQAPRLLNGLVSNDLTALPVGRALYAFVLTPKGRILADSRILNLGSELWLDVRAASLEGLSRHFATYLPPRFVNIEVIEGMRRASLIGPRWREALPGGGDGDAGAEASHASSLHVLSLSVADDAGLNAVVREEEDGHGLDIYLPADQRESALARLAEAVAGAGGAAASVDAFDIWRVERGIPLYGPDISLENLPQETGLESRAVSFDKGCYTGQEVVARIHYRGHVNRHLRGLAFEVGPPKPGAPLYAGRREVAAVTSAVTSPRLGPIGLGYVRREIEPGAALSLSPEGAPDCHVRNLPFTST